MAGSWNHMVGRTGRLLNNENFCGMIENLGDAYEAAEEAYGMVWYLARAYSEAAMWGRQETKRPDLLEVIEQARQHYKDGLREGGVQRER